MRRRSNKLTGLGCVLMGACLWLGCAEEPAGGHGVAQGGDVGSGAPDLLGGADAQAAPEIVPDVPDTLDGHDAAAQPEDAAAPVDVEPNLEPTDAVADVAEVTGGLDAPDLIAAPDLTDVPDVPEPADVPADVPAPIEAISSEDAIVEIEILDITEPPDLAAADPDPPPDDVSSDVTETVAEDVSDVAAPMDLTSAGDEAGTTGDDSVDAAASDAETAPEPTGNLKFTFPSPTSLAPGWIYLRLVTPEDMAKGELINIPGAFVAYDGPAATLPMTVWTTAPVGTWIPFAMFKATQKSFMPKAIGIPCANGAKLELTITGAETVALPVEITFAVLGTGAAPSPTTACLDPNAKPDSGALPFTELATTSTPATLWGGMHFMAAHVWDERLWIAGSQDGYVSFDYPANPPEPAPEYHGWHVWEGQFCNRIERLGATLYCSSRAEYLQILENPPTDTNAPPAPGSSVTPLKVTLPGAKVTEGMAIASDRIYVAAHMQGLVALSPAPPYEALPLASPPLVDAWDVKFLDPDHLIVADGKAGLVVLDVTGPLATAPEVVATLPLAGVSAYLTIESGAQRVAVGALSGGVHLVATADVKAPSLIGSVNGPNLFFNSTFQGGALLTGAGHHVLAIALPAAGKPGPLSIRSGIDSKGYAFEVRTFGEDLLTAEFQAVRRLHFDPAKMAVVPVLLMRDRGYSHMTQVGGNVEITIPVYNAGSATLQIDKAMYIDAKDGMFKWQEYIGPWKYAPGKGAVLSFKGKKMTAGNQIHAVQLITNDPARPTADFQVTEIGNLQPGDEFPKTLGYMDAFGAYHDVSAAFAGKVGVFIAAAHSCPVAFQSLAAASEDLKPLIEAGTIVAYAVNAWDLPNNAPEIDGIAASFPVLYSGLNSKDDHSWSDVLDGTLGQPVQYGPPMPVIYVVGKDGKIAFVQWGYQAQRLKDVIAAAAK